MYILSQSELEIYDSRVFERFAIVTKHEDAKLVVGSRSKEAPPDTLGRYVDIPEAKTALRGLLTALTRNDPVYEMPLSSLVAPEHERNDSRTKRRGGS